jgi:uncharacterized membrane protein (DUF106 family)
MIMVLMVMCVGNWELTWQAVVHPIVVKAMQENTTPINKSDVFMVMLIVAGVMVGVVAAAIMVVRRLL